MSSSRSAARATTLGTAPDATAWSSTASTDDLTNELMILFLGSTDVESVSCKAARIPRHWRRPAVTAADTRPAVRLSQELRFEVGRVHARRLNANTAADSGLMATAGNPPWWS